MRKAEKHLILRTQANGIFEDIQKLGLNPSEFEWLETESGGGRRVISVLSHKPTGYYFAFELQEVGGHLAKMSPGQESPVEYDHTRSWANQYRRVGQWLASLKKEYEAPDLWGAVALEAKLAEAAAAEGDDNAPLTPEELDQVSGQLDEIRQYVISTHNLVEEHAEFVNRRFDYLDDALKRMGRRDWLHTLIGVLFTVVTAVSMSAEETREIFRFAAVSLQLFIGRFLPSP